MATRRLTARQAMGDHRQTIATLGRPCTLTNDYEQESLPGLQGMLTHIPFVRFPSHGTICLLLTVRDKKKQWYSMETERSWVIGKHIVNVGLHSKVQDEATENHEEKTRRRGRAKMRASEDKRRRGRAKTSEGEGERGEDEGERGEDEGERGEDEGERGEDEGERGEDEGERGEDEGKQRHGRRRTTSQGRGGSGRLQHADG
jgi:hypothetical protein